MTRFDRITTSISDQELARRWTAIRAAMAERGIEALVMQSANDWLGGYVKWFTDIPANNGYPRSVIFHADELMSIVEMGPFDERRGLDGKDPVHRGVGEILGSPSFLSIDYTQGYDAALVAGVLRHRGYRTIGTVGGGAFPHRFAAILQQELAGRANLTDATDLVDRIKAVKSDEEIGLIRRAAAMQDAVFAKVLAAIKPGMRDVDVTALAQHEGQILGSEQGVLLGSSAPLGVRSGFVGRHLQGRTLEAGDCFPLLIENNGPGGFYTEIARTMVLGRASAEIRDGFEIVRAAQEHTLGLMKPGTPCRDIAAAHDAYMARHGLPPETRLYSHGQGYDMVERPLVRRDETMALLEGMCLSVHPGYETPSLFAVICDNYLIGAAGPGECLHQTKKQVFEVD